MKINWKEYTIHVILTLFFIVSIFMQNDTLMIISSILLLIFSLLNLIRSLLKKFNP